ncbi:GNAT family N-acetyltransferase [Streptomyces sp. NPDC089919]|uniref:GNAT family N-acetyltransferase n=1 Tax=Streptomyces sp. NPDC089919 TaxID=3155188 RepID=UPI00341BCAF9
MTEPRTAARIRPAEAADLARIVELIHEHAAYERAAPPAPGLADRLAPLLFGPDRAAATGPERGRDLRVLLAETGTGEDRLVVGYAALATEFAFWEGRSYLHMDCLYLAEQARGHGLGAALMDGVRRYARELGLEQVQWQTPDWNADAIRFYDRLGAAGKPKLRYGWTV